MYIYEVDKNKKQYMSLFLIADESESMINRYLNHGTVYVLDDNGTKGVCVLTKETNCVIEIKNIAVNPNFQRKGYGKTLINFIIEKYKNQFNILQVGTGNVPQVLSFYKKCGFSYSHTVRNFFVENYDHPIYENGIKLIDMVYLRLKL